MHTITLIKGITELQTIKKAYNATDQKTIKSNIKHLMKLTKTNASTISQILDISIHTSYSYTNSSNKNKPELINLMILSKYFNVSIYNLLKR